LAWPHAVGDLRGGEEAGCVGVVNGCNEQAAKLVGLLLYRIWRDFRSFPVCAEQRK
jgi:hypothetical protein